MGKPSRTLCSQGGSGYSAGVWSRAECVEEKRKGEKDKDEDTKVEKQVKILDALFHQLICLQSQDQIHDKSVGSELSRNPVPFHFLRFQKFEDGRVQIISLYCSYRR